jgi:hypothetical protein
VAEVGATFVTVAPSARGFGSKLNSQIGGEVKGSGSRAGKIFGGAMKLAAGAAIGGALALGGFLKGALGEAREAQKVGALTNAVIKSTGGIANVTAKDVDRLSASLSKKIGVDDEAIAAGQNMLLTFGNVRNEVGKGNQIFTRATIAANDMAAAFGGDAVSNSKMLGKALNDPTKGVSALTRVGVSFTQQQKDQIKTLQESGDVLGAQKIILGEVSKQTKGAAAATATAGDKFKVAFGNFQESVGTALLPLFDRLLGGLTKFVVYLTNDIGPGIAALNGYLAPAIASVKAFFSGVSAGGGVTSKFVPVLQTMGNTFTTKILPALKRLGAYLLANFVPIFQKVGSIISTQVVPIIAKLAQFLYGTLYPAIVKIVTQIAGSLKPVFDALFQSIQTNVLPTVSKLLAKFQEWWPTISKVIMIVLKVIGAVLRLAAAILGKVLPPLIKFAGFLLRNVVSAVIAVIGVLVKIVAWIIKVGSAVSGAIAWFSKFAKAVDARIRDALKFIASLPGKAKDALGDLGRVLFDAGKKLIQGLIDGIKEKMQAAVDAVRAGLQKIKDMLPGSPIKTGPLVGWNNGGAGKRLIEQGLISGIDSKGPALTDSMTRLASRLAIPRLAVATSVGSNSGGAGTGAQITVLDKSGSPTQTAHETARLLAWGP